MWTSLASYNREEKRSVSNVSALLANEYEILVSISEYYFL